MSSQTAGIVRQIACGPRAVVKVTCKVEADWLQWTVGATVKLSVKAQVYLGV